MMHDEGKTSFHEQLYFYQPFLSVNEVFVELELETATAEASMLVSGACATVCCFMKWNVLFFLSNYHTQHINYDATNIQLRQLRD